MVGDAKDKNSKKKKLKIFLTTFEFAAKFCG
jgi:hypothetical protein